ncbi:MAG: hypothetical protein WAV76_01290 [Bacteroidota bacterium]
MKKNVLLNSIKSSIIEFLLPTPWAKHMSLLIDINKTVIMLTERYYDVGKRMSIFIPTKKGKYEFLKLVQTELKKKNIPSTIRIIETSKRRAVYLRLECDYNVSLILKVISTIILNVYQLSEDTLFDILVSKSEIHILKQIPSDPIYQGNSQIKKYVHCY